MQLHKLITLALVVVLFSVALSSQSISRANTVQNKSNGSGFYNFSGLPVGAYPKNTSWVNFSVLNNMSTTFDQIVETMYGNALDVATSDYYASSYLAMNFTTRNSTAISFNFGWNNYKNSGLTEDYIIVQQDGQNLSKIYFGTEYSGKTFVKSGDNNYSTFGAPSMTSTYNLTISFSTKNSDYLVLSMKESGLRAFSVPLRVPLPVSYDNSGLSILIGGGFSNMTIYNLSDYGSLNSQLNFSTKETRNFNSTQYNLTPNDSPLISNSLRPYIDVSLNSIIYVSQNGNIVSFNYFNRSYKILYDGSGISSGSEYGDYYSNSTLMYYLYNDSTLSFVSINPWNFSVSVEQYHVTLNSTFYIDLVDGKIFLFNDTGAFYSFNDTTGSLINKMQVPFVGGNSSEFKIVSASISNSILSISAFSNSKKEFETEQLYSSNFSLIESKMLNYTISTQNLVIDSYAYQNGIYQSIVLENVTFGNSLFFAENNTYISTPNPTYTKVIGANSGIVAFDYDNVVELYFSDGIVYSTDLHYTNGATISYSPNLSYGVIESPGSFVLFYSKKIPPYSSYGISITGAQEYLLRNCVYVNFTVNSSLEYVLTAHISNQEFVSVNNGTLTVNSSKLSNGTFIINATTRNLAGYSYSFLSNAVVDNSVPNILLSPGNNTDIGNFSTVYVNVSDYMGVAYVYVDFLNHSYSFTKSNISFFFNAGKYQGKANLTVTVVDKYGISCTSNYVYDIIGFDKNNFSTNIWNGEFVNVTSLPLKWSNVSNVSHYIVVLLGENSSSTINTTFNETYLQVQNGEYNIKIEAVLIDNHTYVLGDDNITVQTFRPQIYLNYSKERYYSFFGNSANDTYELYISSNVSSYLEIKIIAPNNKTIISFSSEDTYKLIISNNTSGFESTGWYTVSIRAVSLSGTIQENLTNFFVNNSIPIKPYEGHNVIYTNSSLINLTIVRSNSISNQITTYTPEGTQFGYHSAGGLFQLHLDSGNGIYRVNISDYSLTGNHNYSSVTVYYYSSSPSIKINIAEHHLTNVNYTYLEYNVSDPVPLASLRISVGNESSFSVKDPAKNGQQRISFASNGKFLIKVYVSDYCGNYNTSPNESVQVTYYVEINSINISENVFGQSGNFKLMISGNNTGHANISWFVNGNIVGYGTRISTNLKLGSNTVKAVVKFDNSSLMVEKKVYVVGFVPVYAVLAGSAALSAAYILTRNRDEEEIKNLVLGCDGMKISGVIRAGKKRKMPRSKITKVIKELKNDELLEIGRDPDNNQYIMLR